MTHPVEPSRNETGAILVRRHRRFGRALQDPLTYEFGQAEGLHDQIEAPAALVSHADRVVAVAWQDVCRIPQPGLERAIRNRGQTQVLVAPSE